MMGALEHETDVCVPVSAARALRAALERVLALDDARVHKLGYARTSVRFVIEEEAVTVLLDRRPPVLGGGAEPAEVEIELMPRQAGAFARGELRVAEELLAGTVRASGPLRDYLEVEPILACLLRGACEPFGADAAAAGARTPKASPARQPGGELLAIETRELCTSFGSHRVLNGMNLTVPAGLISVVLGPSGTGKSVLVKHIIGLMRADSGDVLVRGRPLQKMSRSELLALRVQVGVMFQDGALFSTMTVFDNVAFPLRQHTDLGERAVREIVMDQLAAVGLQEARELMPAELSGGMRKRAGLARSLVMDPAVLICDEPDSGLDPVRTALLADVIRDVHERNGGTIMVITHNIGLARTIADYVSVMWKGCLVASGLAGEVFASEDPFIHQFLTGDASGPLDMD